MTPVTIPMSPALDKLSRDLRSAILDGELVRAGSLASEYSAALRAHWEALQENERVASPIPRQARELITWAKEMAVIQRTMAAAQLNIVLKARRYNAARSVEAPRPSLQLRG